MATIREKLMVMIGVEGEDKFARDMKKAQSDTKKSAGGMSKSFKDTAKAAAAMGAAAIAAVTAVGVVVFKLASQVASLGDEWDKMSKRVGLSAEVLSALSFAADRSGTSIQSLEIGFRRLAANMLDASQGIGIAKGAFDRLGITVTDSEGKLKAQDRLLLELADTLGQMTNSTERAALAQDIFGRSGVEMLPLLAEGSKGIGALMGKAEELGEVFSGKLAKDSADFQDAMRDAGGAAQGLKNAIATDLIPEITRLTNDVLIPAVKALREFVQWYNAVLNRSGGFLGAGGQGVAETAFIMQNLEDAGVLSGRGRGQGQGLVTAGRRDEGRFRTPTTAARALRLGPSNPAIREMRDTVTGAVFGPNGEGIIGFEQATPKMKEQLVEVAETVGPAFEKIPTITGGNHHRNQLLLSCHHVVVVPFVAASLSLLSGPAQ